MKGHAKREPRLNEQEWLDCTDPARKLCHFRGQLRDGFNRKIRLFACACCRLAWSHLIDNRSRKAVEVAERFADGEATREELKAAWDAASQAHQEVYDQLGKVGSSLEWAAQYTADPIAFHGARNVSWMAAKPRCYEVRKKLPDHGYDISLHSCEIKKNNRLLSLILGGWQVRKIDCWAPTGAETPVQLTLIDDIFGNPFRPVTLDPGWLSPGLVGLARTIYDQRAFHRLAELADALEDAGCSNADVLNHCRRPGVHVRGCWVVDLILGKT